MRDLIHHIESWVLLALFWGVLALRVWALVDSITRKAPAFAAANKLTKPVWVLLNAISVAIGLLFGPAGFLNLLSYISIIVSSVYLADVRPAVREISGPSRW